ncbi:uncharacterized protein KD926_007471 [Aspergillus affinis]|uniref:uncharacterized protein n=1 Tax=Aspergillus affinis TaxID=1070780 RepID=UPI0022FE5820|nr:uncharacterized protein KD926_007471 [Aspergillus affinis]KAI9041054.1 hypothetical protein KD926_007471 [Aspergillus affinis]
MDPSTLERFERSALDQSQSYSIQEPPATGLLGPRSIALGLTRVYATDWTVPDALRELYQNWKDAILQSHPMSLLEFAPHVSATSEAITIIVEAQGGQGPGGAGPLARKILGYIRFNKAQGSAEFTNLGSSLDPQHLEMGHTTKKRDDRLAGGHGEGLKLAALVLSRAEHHVKISASGLYWNFGFNGQAKANFYCRLTPAKAKREIEAPSNTGHPSRLSADVGRDVSVLVEKGQKGQRLSLNDFGRWMRDTVDLHAPSSSVRTSVGDLLLGPVHRGQLYLKGLRVPDSSHGQQPFRFGYNLVRGSVDRDRQRLVNPQQVVASIHSIWENAITQDETKVLPRYLELLRDHPSSADAKGAEGLVTESTARKLWVAICREPTAAETFFCAESKQNEDRPVIRSELKKESRPLPDSLWSIFRTYRLVRKPFEELQRRLENSDVVAVPVTAFAHGMVRTLHALLALDSLTRQTMVVFVRCTNDSVDMAYQTEGERLYVHEKWLHAQDDYGSGPKDSIPHQSGSDAVTSHTVAKELFDRAVTLIGRQTRGPHSDQSLQLLRRLAYRRLHEMPCMIQMHTTDEATKTARVSFYTGHSLVFTELYGALVSYLVVLHGPHCVHQSVDLVYDSSRDVCRCPRQVVPLGTRTAVFKDLDPGPWTPTVIIMPAHNSPIIPTREHGFEPVPKAEDGALVGTSALPVSPPTWGTIREPPETEPRPLEVTVSHIATQADDPPQLHTETASMPTNLISLNQEAQAVNQPSPTPDSEALSRHPTLVDGNAITGPGCISPTIMPSIYVDRTSLKTHDSREKGWILSSVAELPEQTVSDTSQRHSSPPESTSAVGAIVSKATVDFSVAHPSEVHDADSVASCSSLPGILPAIAGENSAWWRTWPGQFLDADGQQGGSKRNLTDAEDSCGPYEQISPFRKGTYVRVRLEVADSDSSASTRYIFYVHDILPPIGTSGVGGRLLVTKFSFLVDLLPCVAECLAAEDQELLLHFHNPERMAHQDDADVVNVSDVVAVGPHPLAVSLLADMPEPAVGLFARYGILEGSGRESLFMTPIAPYLPGPKDGPAFPRFSPLPVASVFDLSPGDPRLSVGFAQAGYRVSAAVGYDEDHHQLWKVHHPDAAVFPGCVASALAEIDSQKKPLPDIGGSQVPRIVTIGSECPSSVFAPGALDSDPMEVAHPPEGSLGPLQRCELAAQSPGLSPDFIVLTTSRTALQDQLWGALASTIRFLLTHGYSVTLRLIRLGALDGEWSVLLLAAPRRTHPQWIDDALSDLRMTPTPEKALTGHIGALQPGQGNYCPVTSSSVNPSPYQDVRGAGVLGAVHPDLPTGSVRANSVGTLSPNGLPVAEHCQPNSILQVDEARQIAATVSRIIGQFSTSAPHPPPIRSPVLISSNLAAGSDERNKRRRIEELV